MKDYTTNNLLYLRKHYTNIYHLLRNRERNASQYVLSETKSNFPTLAYQASSDQTPVFYHSKYDPTHEAERWADQVTEQISNVKHLVIYGLGLGYHLEEICRRFPDKKIYLYEPDPEVMLALLQARDMQLILQSPNIVTLGVGSDATVSKQFVKLVLTSITESFDLLVTPAYQKLYDDQLSEFRTNISVLTLGIRGNYSTAISFQENWTTNIFHNVGDVLNSRSIKHLEQLFKGLPAVVVGSGPSLDEDIETLRKLKNHAIIIAAGTSIQALLHYDIKPHFVVSMDGGEGNYRAFHDLDLSGIPLVYSPFVHHRIVSETAADLYYFYYKIDSITKYLLGARDEPEFYSTSSVTGAAIQLAVHMGCPRIILAGQDLSYPDKTYYTSGVDHLKEGYAEKVMANATEQIENVQGGVNPTTKKMLLTIRDIELLLELFPNTDFVNTSKKGAKINGTVFLPMEEVLAQSSRVTVEESNVYEQVKTITRPYYSDTVRSVHRKLTELEKQIVDLEPKLVDLLNLIESGKKAAAQAKVKIGDLEKIEQWWSEITETVAFKQAYSFVLQGQLSIYLRYQPTIALETDINRKSELIHQYLGRFVLSMLRVTPSLRENIVVALQDVEQNARFHEESK